MPHLEWNEDIPDVWEGLYTALSPLITEAWTEVFGNLHPIYESTQSMRRTWRAFIDSGKLDPPWVVVHVPPCLQERGWGACNVMYRPRVTVFYVARQEDGGAVKVSPFLRKKITDLENRLLKQDYDGFQLWPESFERDISPTNAANETFVRTNQPLYAGSLSFDVLVGYIAPEPTSVP